MTDPVFETREALEGWLQGMRLLAHNCRRFGYPALASDTEDCIRRVTAAHQHLKETPRHD